MNVKIATIVALALVFMTPGSAAAKDKKHLQRGMLEKMQAIPCGVKERGLTSLGGLWAGIGIQHVNSDEKLCPQYLFRTDEMDYHLRPADMKHAVLLPVGHEGEFKIKKNRMYLKIPDGDKKARAYQVVSMEPHNSHTETENTAYNPAHESTEYRRTEVPTNRQAINPPAGSPPQ